MADDRYTILLVDDEPDVRAALRRSLHVPGYVIHECSDGVEAIEFLRKHDVDAVVSDYNMPRMNGLDLLTQVRIIRPEVLRILITARADVHLAVRALNEGSVHRFLLKPWDHIDLRGILRMALHTMRPARAALGGR
jgi:DNA-binding NtrC family response regulator